MMAKLNKKDKKLGSEVVTIDDKLGGKTEQEITVMEREDGTFYFILKSLRGLPIISFNKKMYEELSAKSKYGIIIDEIYMLSAMYDELVHMNPDYFRID